MKTKIFLIIVLAFLFSQLYGQTIPYPNNIYGGANSGIVGKLADEFEVTPSGQASYEIPISTVSSTGGMAPQLAIVYNSSLGWLKCA